MTRLVWHAWDAEILDPTPEYQDATPLYCNGPRIHEYLTEMHNVLSKYDTITVGELPATPTVQGVLPYVSAKARQLNMVFNFDTVASFRYRYGCLDNFVSREP